MTSEEYLKQIILKKKASSIDLEDWRLAEIKSIIRTWAGYNLSEFKKSGSNAKGTALKGIADFDLFVSFRSDTQTSLKDLFLGLDTRMKQYGRATRKQNVSIRIRENNLEVDLVPGKIQSGQLNYHSIYGYKKDTWMQTNVDLHIKKVIDSNRINEIILTKIWREINNIDFPSIYLELSVLEALYGKSTYDLASNFISVLTYLRDKFVDTSVIDPANTNNKISDMLYRYEKVMISDKAGISVSRQNWSEIVW